MADTESFYRTLKTLSEYVWENRARRPEIDAWLANFKGLVVSKDSEQYQMLYLLTQFMYFGSRPLRELLKSMFRDLIQYPIIEKIRRENSNTLDSEFVQSKLVDELARTKILGMGNPSESGCHLLYYFRQENRLPKTLFINSHEIFSRSNQDPKHAVIRDTSITRYIFIDDFCGSGSQASIYSKEIVENVRREGSNAEILYFCLIGTQSGMDFVRSSSKFSHVAALYELDDSYRALAGLSRYFRSAPPDVEHIETRDICTKYGLSLEPTMPRGFNDCQLLLGFHHNTPDNSLPVFWSGEPDQGMWTPIFRRYPKIYS
jgi:hypothetical protein